MPRPSLGYATLAPLKVPPEMAAKITALAEYHRLTKQEVVRRSLALGLPLLPDNLPAL